MLRWWDLMEHSLTSPTGVALPRFSLLRSGRNVWLASIAEIRCAQTALLNAACLSRLQLFLGHEAPLLSDHPWLIVSWGRYR